MTSRVRKGRAGEVQDAGGTNRSARRSLLELTGTTPAEHLPDGHSGNASAINGPTFAGKVGAR
jgi:hypothetical protein